MDSNPKRLVIIGGGFAGVNLALQLKRDPLFQITFVDKNNYNFFPPLIYQVATGFLENSNISYPFRKLFRRYGNIQFRLGELLSVDLKEKCCHLSNGDIPYDYLVFATGATTNYFGLENVKKYAIPMKNVNDALNMRNSVLQRLEQASITTDSTERRKLLTLVVAGGGPTGVEVSGMFGDLRKYALRLDYPELHGYGGDIYLVDGGANLLAPMSPASQKDTFDALTKLGIKIKLNTQVRDFDGEKVTLSTGEVIEARTLIWTAGVTAVAFDGIPAASYGRGHRLICDAYNQVTGLEDVFGIGDTCLVTTDPAFPGGHPQVAQVAMQQGRLLAKNLRAKLAGKPMTAFRYHDKGSMAIIGRNKAVADLPKPKLHFRGFIAWAMWLFIHLISLINYRNRIKTLYNWTINYLNKDQSLRFIVRPRKSQTTEI